MEFLDDLTLSVGRKKGTGNFCELSLTYKHYTFIKIINLGNFLHLNKAYGQNSFV